jgi:hypothetical protein
MQQLRPKQILHVDHDVALERPENPPRDKSLDGAVGFHPRLRHVDDQMEVRRRAILHFHIREQRESNSVDNRLLLAIYPPQQRGQTMRQSGTLPIQAGQRREGSGGGGSQTLDAPGIPKVTTQRTTFGAPRRRQGVRDSKPDRVLRPHRSTAEAKA